MKSLCVVVGRNWGSLKDLAIRQLVEDVFAFLDRGLPPRELVHRGIHLAWGGWKSSKNPVDAKSIRQNKASRYTSVMVFGTRCSLGYIARGGDTSACGGRSTGATGDRSIGGPPGTAD